MKFHSSVKAATVVQVPTKSGMSGKYDVLCGRGGAANSNHGNVVYRDLVQRKKKTYINASTNKMKGDIVQYIIFHIQKMGGRFLMQVPGENRWEEVSKDKAFRKTGQALREKTQSKQSLARLCTIQPSSRIRGKECASKESSKNLQTLVTRISHQTPVASQPEDTFVPGGNKDYCASSAPGGTSIAESDSVASRTRSRSRLSQGEGSVQGAHRGIIRDSTSGRGKESGAHVLSPVEKSSGLRASNEASPDHRPVPSASEPIEIIVYRSIRGSTSGRGKEIIYTKGTIFSTPKKVTPDLSSVPSAYEPEGLCLESTTNDCTNHAPTTNTLTEIMTSGENEKRGKEMIMPAKFLGE